MSGTYLDRLFPLSAPAYRHNLSEGHRPNSMVCRRNGGHVNSRAAYAGVTRGCWCAVPVPIQRRHTALAPAQVSRLSPGLARVSSRLDPCLP